MATYKIVKGKFVKQEEPKQNTSNLKIVQVTGPQPYVPSVLTPQGQQDYLKENYDITTTNGTVSYKPKTGGSSSSNSTPTTTAPKTGGSSSSNSTPTTTAPTAPKPIDMDKLKQDLASGTQKLQIADTERNRQIQQQSIKGGTFVNPYGGIISSTKSELELNQGKLNEPTIEEKDYFKNFGRVPLADALSKGKKFVGSFVKIGEVGADQKEVEEAGNIFISKAKDRYAKNIFSNITANQLAQKEFEEKQKELDKKRQKQFEISEKNRYEAQAKQEAKEGKISGGLKLAGLELEKLGQNVSNSKAKISLPPTDPLFLMSNVLGDAPKQFTSGFIKGVGETAKSAGDIVSAASKRQTYVELAKVGKGTAEYFINVGKTAEIKGIKVKPGDLFPVQLDIQPGKQTKKDIETAKLLGLTAGTKAVSNFVKDPFTESGKLVGSGATIGGVTSISGKLMGLGKAGVKIAKGGKYIKYEDLYETNPKNLIKGRYKTGTPTSTIKEFKTGKNPKTLFHSTGTDFINPKTGRARVIAPAKSPKTDPKALFGSTGKANETYLRISGESYNLKPRIPFVNMPSKIKPATYRLVGTTTPKKLTTLGKVKNLKQGKKLFETATTSKNIPYTSPANTLGIKAENEALLRPGTVLSKKGLKGTQDFTFVKGVFVETPRVRVMPSKPRINIGRPARPSIIKKPVAKPVRQVSFSSSIEQARSPGTFYNPSSLFRSSSPVRSSSKVSFSPRKGSSVSYSPSRIISSSKSPSISSSPSPRPSPSRNPFRSSNSTSRSSSSSFISSKSSFSNSSSTIKSSTKPPIYKPSLLYKQTKYNKIAPRSKYGLKNVIRFNSFGGKTRVNKVRFL